MSVIDNVGKTSTFCGADCRFCNSKPIENKKTGFMFGKKTTIKSNLFHRLIVYLYIAILIVDKVEILFVFFSQHILHQYSLLLLIYDYFSKNKYLLHISF